MMGDFLTVGKEINSLFFFVILGFWGRKKGILTENSNKALADLIFYFAMPALTLSSMNFPVLEENIKNAWLILLVAFLLVIFSYLSVTLVAYLLRLPPKEDYAFRCTAAFSNVTYLGFPVSFILFGPLGVFYAAMYSLAHNLLLWSLGVWLMSRHRQKYPDIREILNLNVLAIIGGFTLALFKIHLPELILKPLASLGQTTIPWSLILIGSMLGEANLAHIIKNKLIYLIIIIRLLVFPGLTLLLVAFLSGWDVTSRAILVIEMAMPAAAIAPAIARKYEGAYQLVAAGVVATTLISLVTLPAFVWAIFYQIMT